MADLMDKHESFVIDTEAMRNSVMDRGQHAIKQTGLFGFLNTTDLIKSIGAGLGLFSVSTGMAGNDDLVILDMSYWQDDARIDYELLSQHIDGVILRAVYGIWEDTRFKIHYRNFKQYGVPLGAYDYFIGNYSGHQQAEVFKSVVDGLELKLGYWADVEDQREGTALTRTVVDDFISRGDSILPQKLDIYTGPYCWTAIMGTKGGYGDRKLWLANYGVLSPRMPINSEWADWWIWQYTDKEYHDGYYSTIDTNRYHYSTEMYKDWVGEESQPEPLPEPSPEDVLFQAQCIVGALNVRSGPSSSYSVVGALYDQEIVNVYEVADNGWYRIGDNEWCSGNESYMLVVYVEPEPTPNPEPEDPVNEMPETWQEAYFELKNRIDTLDLEVQSIKEEIR